MNKARDYYKKVMAKPEFKAKFCKYCGGLIVSVTEEEYCCLFCKKEALNPDADLKFCKYCGSPIIGRSPNAEYCCEDCGLKGTLEIGRKLNPGRGRFSPGVAGGINESRVNTDLLMKGYAMFRSTCQCAPCDFIAMKDGRIYRVEVTAGSYGANGKVYCGMHDPDNYDIIAAVTFDNIFYKDAEGNEIKDLTSLVGCGRMKEIQEKEKKLEEGRDCNNNVNKQG